MKVLFITPNYYPATRYGGPIRSSHGLAKALVARGHSVNVYTTNVDGNEVLNVRVNEPIDIDGVSVRYFPITQPKRIYYSPVFGRALEETVSNFDVLHINGTFLWPGPKAARTAAKFGVPFVLSPRGMLTPEMIAGKSRFAKTVWIRLFERRALALAKAIHVTSTAEASGVRLSKLDLAPLAVVGNGVDLPDHLPTPEEIDKAWGIVPPGSRVLFLGRLDWTKGVDLAIATVSKHPSAFLVIAGHDQIGLRAQLDPLLSRADGSTVGQFIGPVEGTEKWTLLYGADVLLAPSVAESFGIAVAEALAVGTPVICTEGVGAKSVVSRIDAGCVVPRQISAISASLNALLGDSQRREKFSRCAKALMAAEYTWAAVAEQMEKVYFSSRA